jgi:hypothetical protein
MFLLAMYKLTQFVQILSIDKYQQYGRFDILPVLPDWIAAVAALAAVGAVIWGTLRIINELQLRAIDSIGGFNTHFAALLVMFKKVLGDNVNDSVLKKLYSFEKPNNEDKKYNEKRKKFQEQVSDIITLLTTAQDQLPLSEKMLNNRNKLLESLLVCQRWEPTRFYKESYDSLKVAYDNIEKPTTEILLEINERTPALLNVFWENVDKANRKYKRKQRRENNRKQKREKV